MKPEVERDPSVEASAILRIAAQDAPHLDAEFVDGLRKAVDEIRGMPNLRSVTLAGTRQYFSAGATRESLLTASSGQSLGHYVREVPRLLLDIPVMTIAAMEGHAVGGGLVLGLWCDLAVLAEESLYGANFMALGFTPGMGSTRLLESWVGRPLAREMLYTGRMFKGREIREAGVPVSHSVVPRDEVMARAASLAESVAEHPRRSMELLRSANAERDRALLDDAGGPERRMHGELFGTAETRDAIEQRYAGSGAVEPEEEKQS